MFTKMADKYKKVELIGSGTFGRVWLVLANETLRKYAVKEIQVSAMSSRDKEQALTEVSALGRCKHVNVIRYKEAFVDRGMLNIAMEYADGGDLHSKIKQQKGVCFSEPIVLDWYTQICFGLRYIHGRNILHRDLKSQNIFLTKNGTIKIGDFGIAKILQDTSDHARTAIGTPYYLSPEICQRKPYNHKSDIWASGCVLYELVCLRHPFDGMNFSELALKIMQGRYKPIPSHYSALVEDIISILLRIDATKRPSARQILCIPVMQPNVDAYITRMHHLHGNVCNSIASMNIHDKRKFSVAKEGKTSFMEEEKENVSPETCSLPPKRPRKHSLSTPRPEDVMKDRRSNSAEPADQGMKQSKISMKNSPKYSLYMDIVKRQKRELSPLVDWLKLPTRASVTPEPKCALFEDGGKIGRIKHSLEREDGSKRSYSQKRSSERSSSQERSSKRSGSQERSSRTSGSQERSTRRSGSQERSSRTSKKSGSQERLPANRSGIQERSSRMSGCQEISGGQEISSNRSDSQDRSSKSRSRKETNRVESEMRSRISDIRDISPLSISQCRSRKQDGNEISKKSDSDHYDVPMKKVNQDRSKRSGSEDRSNRSDCQDVSMRSMGENRSDRQETSKMTFGKYRPKRPESKERTKCSDYSDVSRKSASQERSKRSESDETSKRSGNLDSASKSVRGEQESESECMPKGSHHQELSSRSVSEHRSERFGSKDRSMRSEIRESRKRSSNQNGPKSTDVSGGSVNSEIMDFGGYERNKATFTTLPTRMAEKGNELEIELRNLGKHPRPRREDGPDDLFSAEGVTNGENEDKKEVMMDNGNNGRKTTACDERIVHERDSSVVSRRLSSRTYKVDVCQNDNDTDKKLKGRTYTVDDGSNGQGMDKSHTTAWPTVIFRERELAPISPQEVTSILHQHGMTPSQSPFQQAGSLRSLLMARMGHEHFITAIEILKDYLKADDKSADFEQLFSQYMSYHSLLFWLIQLENVACIV